MTGAMTDLPIDAAIPDLYEALAAHGRAVLVAPPGAGKTTRVPLALLDLVPGRIVMLEPRRLAARAAAERMAATLAVMAWCFSQATGTGGALQLPGHGADIVLGALDVRAGLRIARLGHRGHRLDGDLAGVLQLAAPTLGAAVLGVLADHTSIFWVYQVISFLPLLGIVAAFLPNRRHA